MGLNGRRKIKFQSGSKEKIGKICNSEYYGLLSQMIMLQSQLNQLGMAKENLILYNH